MADDLYPAYIQALLRPAAYPHPVDTVQLVQELLAGYVDSTSITAAIDTFIVPPGLGSQAGVLGAIALGQRLCNS